MHKQLQAIIMVVSLINPAWSRTVELISGELIGRSLQI
jgi:hypothetical protein